ncbi:MAG: DUF4160 domain-containing protein [Bacteroides sp.]|nr:DUF4160 domain-containing protein [Bacteroides sp.]MCM1086393.1 DUF4160 domain-containing protein [Bacteroides sp.]
MPKIFEYFGFIFFFYSREHEPIHVHVIHEDCGLIFELIMEGGELVEVRQRKAHGFNPLSAKDANVAKEFIQKYHKNIVKKWVDFFLLKKVVRCTNIKTRL